MAKSTAEKNTATAGKRKAKTTGQPQVIAGHHDHIALVLQGGGAVNVMTGNSVYFDNADRIIGPEHVMASGALLAKLPPELMDDPHVKHLADAVRTAHTDIVQLIYRQASYELESKDYEFSRVSVLEHWQAGLRDMRDTITHPEWLKSTGIDEGVTQYDLTRHTRPL